MALPKGALPPSSRHVLTVLAWHCNELAVRRGDRQCRPSLNTMAAETSLDRTTCMRAVDVLEKRGFIGVQRKSRVANRYELTDPAAWPFDQQRARGRVTRPDSGGITPPDKAHRLLQSFAKLVVSGNQPGGVVRPEQVFQKSEQEVRIEHSDRKAITAKPPHRTQAEQLAFVKAMTKGS
jgi:DNA-binding transcriptional MocR family regulator